MLWSKLIVLLKAAGIGVIMLVCFKYGYYQGYTKCDYNYSSTTSKLIDRSKQNDIHEILGRYQGNFTDNDSYDYDRINRLFR